MFILINLFIIVFLFKSLLSTYPAEVVQQARPFSLKIDILSDKLIRFQLLQNKPNISRNNLSLYHSTMMPYMGS